MTDTIIHRGCTIEYNPKPIGTCAYDWDCLHPSYDGDGNPGVEVWADSENSINDCREAIDDLFREIS